MRDGLFLLVCASNGLGYSRMGLMVSRRFGKSVRRNRLKRLCREVFRLARRQMPVGIDFVVLPKGRPESYSLETVDQSLRKLLNSARTRLGC